DERSDQLSAPANRVTNAATLNLKPHLDAEGAVLVKLELTDAAGRVISENFYWQGRDEAALRALNELPKGEVTVAATSTIAGEEVRVTVQLENKSARAVLANKLTLLDAKGVRILPAYYSDNYISLLPGERR